ncbi:hypothetical protein [Nocardioides immobilis]|nr:hypothetical protein [Nocardioides immobilis]
MKDRLVSATTVTAALLWLAALALGVIYCFGEPRGVGLFESPWV